MLLATTGLVGGCEGEHEPSGATIQLVSPIITRQPLSFNERSIYAEVKINEEDLQVFHLDRVGPDREVVVRGIKRNESNYIRVDWYEEYLGNNLLLARQEDESLEVDDSQAQIELRDRHSYDFDCDGDELSNIDERRNPVPNPEYNEWDPCGDYVLIERGSFNRGRPLNQTEAEMSMTGAAVCDDDDPYRNCDQTPEGVVRLDAFLMKKTEVTEREYKRFLNNFIVENEADPDDYPVVDVNWSQADAYAKWVGEHYELNCFLPSEAQWEYAIRAGTTTKYFWEESANDYDEYAVFNADKKVAVATKNPNRWGLYDMAGNVAEWTNDCYTNTYENYPVDGSAYNSVNGVNCVGLPRRISGNDDDQSPTTTVDKRVVRGGQYKQSADHGRSYFRLNSPANIGYPTHGFRVACEISN